MQFIVTSRRLTEKFPESEFAALGEAEKQAARALYTEGTIRQIWHRADIAGACLLLEAASAEAAHESLLTLPLYGAGMIDFTIIPLKPYAGFAPR